MLRLIKRKQTHIGPILKVLIILTIKIILNYTFKGALNTQIVIAPFTLNFQIDPMRNNVILFL